MVIFKVNMAHAFRNLRADPVDSLKLGIYWRGAYYEDIGIALDARVIFFSDFVRCNSLYHEKGRHPVKMLH